jgi:cell division septation protein DedD
MPKTETGEFELVLGNRQLLSGFAVVAILFGVFFAMGYIVGRNSTPSARLMASDTASPAGSAGQAEVGAVQTPASPVAAPAAPLETPAAAKVEEKSAPPEEKKEAPVPATRPQEQAKSTPKPAETASAVQSNESLPSGSYLQVIATVQSDAQVISKSLHERRFPNVITPSSLEGRYRVLVGPYKDATGVGGAKTALENLGFHPIVVRIADRT